MKLTSVELHPEGSSLICDLSFRDPKRLKPYIIKAIGGLDAEDIVPRYYGVSGNQSLKYYNLMLEKRDIIIRIEMNPDFATGQSYSDLRDDLYKMIASARTGILEVQFKNVNQIVASARGFIKKFEAPTSTKTPEVLLTIACDDPMLKSPTLTEVDITGFDPGYTILDDQESTAPHGFNFIMDFTGPTDTVTIQDPNDLSWIFSVSPSGGFLVGDALFFSSEAKNKYLYIEREAEVIQLADALLFSSVWPIMFPGENHFSISPGALMNWRSIQYYATYWGV